LQCPKLTKTNYTLWSILVETVLRAYGLWESIDPVTEATVDEKKNYTTKAIIFQTLPEDILLQVVKYKDVKDVKESIRVQYLGADRVQKVRLQTLRSELEMLKMKENDTINDFSGKVGSVMAKFKSLGSMLYEEVVAEEEVLVEEKEDVEGAWVKWEHPPLAVGTYTASGNSLLAVGMPCAFYSQHVTYDGHN
nr:zinc finger, CCHC-type [Tanacetum cinerariifolium]